MNHEEIKVSKNKIKRRKMRHVPYEELSRPHRILRSVLLGNAYIVHKILNFTISFWLPPVYYLFFMYFIRSRVVSDSSMLRELLEIPYTLYGLINISGNFLMHKYTDVSLQTNAQREISGKYLDKSCGDGSGLDVSYCKKCNMYQLENSWHCKVCEKCVVGRDYHCFIFSQCVTRHNKRYYILGIFYASGALIYSSIYALFYTCSEDDIVEIRALPILGNILFCFALLYSHLGLDRVGCWMTSLILIVNLPLLAVTFGLLVVNLGYVLKRTTYWESKAREKGRVVWKDHVVKSDHSWLQLVEDVLGERWYLAFFSPFVLSPLPKREHKEHLSV